MNRIVKLKNKKITQVEILNSETIYLVIYNIFSKNKIVEKKTRTQLNFYKKTNYINELIIIFNKSRDQNLKKLNYLNNLKVIKLKKNFKVKI